MCVCDIMSFVSDSDGSTGATDQQLSYTTYIHLWDGLSFSDVVHLCPGIPASLVYLVSVLHSLLCQYVYCFLSEFLLCFDA